MKVVNATYGIDAVPEQAEQRTWYRWYRFPLLPIFWYRPAFEMNTADFSFSWLNLRIWSLMSPDIGAGIYLEDIGLHLDVRVPYIKIVFWLLIFPQKWHQKLWRISRREESA